MMKKAAESSQTRAVKQASTRRNGSVDSVELSISSAVVGVGTKVMPIPSKAQHTRRCGLHFSRGREEWRKIADEIADACAQADQQERIAIARPLAQMRDECDGEQAETAPIRNESKMQQTRLRGSSERNAAAPEANSPMRRRRLGEGQRLNTRR